MSSDFLDVTIYIDRSLDLYIKKQLACGTTVAELKALLAEDDPTGDSRPQDCTLTSGGVLLHDSHCLTAATREVELCGEAIGEAELCSAVNTSTSADISISLPATREGPGELVAAAPSSVVAAASSSVVAAPLDTTFEICCIYVYRPTVGFLLVKRVADPSTGKIVKVTRATDSPVQSTGRVWTGPSGGRWTELDAEKGEQRGWALVEGPGFGLAGPALVDHNEPLLDESPPGGEYATDIFGKRRGRCLSCKRCPHYGAKVITITG